MAASFRVAAPKLTGGVRAVKFAIVLLDQFAAILFRASLTCGKFAATQESNAVSEATMHTHTADSEHFHGSAAIQNALLARSSRTAVREHANISVGDLDESLDSVASAKLFGGIVDAYASVAASLTDAGMAVGEKVGNVAIVVGNRVIEPPRLTLDMDQNLADQVGRDVATLGTIAEDSAEIAVQQSINLAKTTLEHAQKTAEEGAKLATAVGNFIADRAVELAEEVKKFLDCLMTPANLCHMLIGNDCDCDAGSYVRLYSNRMEMRCIFQTQSEFRKGFGFDGSGAMTFGNQIEQASEAADQALMTRDEALKELQEEKEPIEAECETELTVAVVGVAQWSRGPEVTAIVEDNGDTTITLTGSVRASLDIIVTGQGSCSYTLTKGVLFSLQMVATLVGSGVLTGTIEMSHDAEFDISATVTAKKNGEATVEVSNGRITHKESVAMVASAEASLTLSFGPELVVWPMPGIPITFAPKINAEASAIGSIGYTPAVSVYTDFEIDGFGLPEWLKDLMNDDFLMQKIRDAMVRGGEALLEQQLRGSCWPSNPLDETIRKAVRKAARDAGDLLANLIPELGLKWDFQPISLLKPLKLFCKEVWSTPENLAEAPCAAELGCEAAGRDPPDESEVEVVPPEQVSSPAISQEENAPGCPSIIPKMGDRFIELGDFRIAESVDNGEDLLAISHKDLSHS
ncbi:unnamed protein product, partial [Symbiodinium necroappetens]